MHGSCALCRASFWQISDGMSGGAHAESTAALDRSGGIPFLLINLRSQKRIGNGFCLLGLIVFRGQLAIGVEIEMSRSELAGYLVGLDVWTLTRFRDSRDPTISDTSTAHEFRLTYWATS